jgi:hypothetical protein
LYSTTEWIINTYIYEKQYISTAILPAVAEAVCFAGEAVAAVVAVAVG